MADQDEPQAGDPRDRAQDRPPRAGGPRRGGYGGGGPRDRGGPPGPSGAPGGGPRGRGGQGFRPQPDRPWQRRDGPPPADRRSGPWRSGPPPGRGFGPRADQPLGSGQDRQWQPRDRGPDEGGSRGRPDRPAGSWSDRPRPPAGGGYLPGRRGGGPRDWDRGPDGGRRPPDRGRFAQDRRDRGPAGPGREFEDRGRQYEQRGAPAAPARATAEDLLAEGEELIAGRRPVEEAFAAGRPAQRLLVVPERRAALEALVLHATTLRIPVVEVEGGTLTSLSGFDGHQGVALAVARRPPAGIDDVLARALGRGQPPFVLVLDSLEDPQNLGTLLRSAEACAIDGVVFPTRRAAPLSPAAIKASAGATEHLLLVAVDDLAAALVDLRARGLRLIGADEGAAMRYGEADLRGPLAIVVGSEGRGISGALRRRLDMVVRIPMRGQVASLNAAVAGSVLLFAAAEQRGVPESGEPIVTGDAAAEVAAGVDIEPPAAKAAPRRARRAAADAAPGGPARATPAAGAAGRRGRKAPAGPPAAEAAEGELLPGETAPAAEDQPAG